MTTAGIAEAAFQAASVPCPCFEDGRIAWGLFVVLPGLLMIFIPLLQAYRLSRRGEASCESGADGGRGDKAGLVVDVETRGATSEGYERRAEPWDRAQRGPHPDLRD